jgi:hypothetical protein
MSKKGDSTQCKMRIAILFQPVTRRENRFGSVEKNSPRRIVPCISATAPACGFAAPAGIVVSM